MKTVVGRAKNTLILQIKIFESVCIIRITSAGPGAERAGIKFKPYEPPFEVKLQSLPVQELIQLDTSQLDDKQKAAYLARLRQLNVGGGRR